MDAARLALLRFLAAQGKQAVVGPEALDRTLDLLTQCELIRPVGKGYRFQVELIRRWFARQVE